MQYLFSFVSLRSLLSSNLKLLFKLSRFHKQVLAISVDIFAALLTVWLAFSLRLEELHWPSGGQWVIYLLAPLLAVPIFTYFGLYHAIYRYNGFSAFKTILKAVFLYGIAFLSLSLVLNISTVPHSIGVLQPIFFLLVTGGSRALVRFLSSMKNKTESRLCQPSEALLIYGAGSAGVQIAIALQRTAKYHIAGLIDDNKELHGRHINGLGVISPEKAQLLIEQKHIKNIILALPSAGRSRRNELITFFSKYPVHLRTLPSIEELADGKVTLSDIKEIDVEELLDRKPVLIDHTLIKNNIGDQVVLVTGAGGSIGSELCRQLLLSRPLKLLLVDNAEHNLYSIHSNLEQRLKKQGSGTELFPLLCDVTDERRIAEICRVFKPTIIYHAAAYKHVPMVEHNPAEGVRNNVFGTLSIAKAAISGGVKNVILVSTDKAVRPTNVMGASKRLCEMIIQALADSSKTTCFSAVRFGNVLASSGSVIPIFRRQIRDGGPLTITHKEITRYFMTIPEAAQLIIHAGVMATGGDVYLLDMGNPVKIMDLARNMINFSGMTLRDELNPEGDIEIHITGLRPGEKLYEELLIDNNPEPTAHTQIYKSNEHFIPWSTLQHELTQLKVIINNNDVHNIKHLLKILIPEYQPMATTSDLLAIQQEKNFSSKNRNNSKTHKNYMKS